MVELAKQELGGDLRDRKVAVLGASFKPNSDDVRDSPALAVAGALHLAGADVRVYDPKGMENAAKVYPPLTYADSAEAAIADAELVVHLTEWQEFKDLDPAALVETVGTPAIIDGRNALDPVAWRAAGWTYRGLGRP